VFIINYRFHKHDMHVHVWNMYMYLELRVVIDYTRELLNKVNK